MKKEFLFSLFCTKINVLLTWVLNSYAFSLIAKIVADTSSTTLEFFSLISSEMPLEIFSALFSRCSILSFSLFISSSFCLFTLPITLVAMPTNAYKTENPILRIYFSCEDFAFFLYTKKICYK